MKPGSQQISVNGSQTLSFQVGSKHYVEQRITIKNQQQVNLVGLAQTGLEFA